MQKWNWRTAIMSSTLFCIIFFFQGVLSPLKQTSGHTGLLFFMIPGMLSAYLMPREGLEHTLLGTLLALPVCTLIRWTTFSSYICVIEMIVYFLGAVFWCGLGALLSIFGLRVLQFCKEKDHS
ncbi:MAG: inner membrane protein YbjM [Plesiomonas sp.]|uniref:inner membrane protein YbjM n=1 Tax=Plesiomonas sp. TaxID=2486279 RepID=UPI003F3E34ED